MNKFAAVGFPIAEEAFGNVLQRVWTEGHRYGVRPGVVQADWAGTSGAGIDVKTIVSGARVASLSAEYDVPFADVEPLPACGETVRGPGRLLARFRRPPGTR